MSESLQAQKIRVLATLTRAWAGTKQQSEPTAWRPWQSDEKVPKTVFPDLCYTADKPDSKRILLLFALLLATGCSQPAATEYATQPAVKLVAEKEEAQDASSGTPAEAPEEITQEIWEETYLQGVKVGFSKTEIAKVREGDATLLRCRQTG